LVIRRATPDDEAAVLLLLGASLGWGDDERFSSFFAWKHMESPYGISPGWVAVDGERIGGFRTFMRWELDGPDGPVSAVRAVDTATHPDHQRRGTFSQLTRRALDELTAEGVGLVFNTPNDRSGPGYLKLGWREVGRIPVCFRPTSPRGLVRLAGARCQADRWSLPVGAGQSATAVVSDPGVADLLASQPQASGLCTRRTPEFLLWRYGYEPMCYRAVLAGPSVSDGFALFRARRRGTAVEATLCELIVPDGDPGLGCRARRRVAATPGVDYVLTTGGEDALRAGFVPLPGQGPSLFVRALAAVEVPALEGWRLRLGDVELF
jgi:GNAT superfamily N-acetyltransferase